MMNAEATESQSNGRRRSWRPQSRGSRSFARQMRRLTALLFGVSLIGLLIYLLASPFWHPNSYLAVMAEPTYVPESGPPSPMASRDLKGVAKLPQFTRLPWQSESPSTRLTSPADILELLQKLESFPFEKSDALVLYVQSRGVVLDGEPMIICRDFELASPADGSFAFNELVRRVGDLRPATKLLICQFDDGRYDPRIGQVAGSFSQAATELFQQTANQEMWMLSSHGMLEQSASSESLGASQFYFWLERGLQGWADRDESESIDVGELHQYVAANVVRASALRSNGYLVQSPQLHWGGGDVSVAQFPTLVSTAGFDRNTQTESIAAIATERLTADASDKGGTMAGLLGAARGVGLSGAGLPGAGLPGSAGAGGAAGNDAGPSAGAENETPAATDDPSDASLAKNEPDRDPGIDSNAEDGANDESTDNAVANGNNRDRPGTTASAAGGAASSEAMANPSSSVKNPSNDLDEIAKGWAAFEQLKSVASPRPIDAAPHLWRKLERTLFWYEREAREQDDEAAPDGSLRQLTFALREMAAKRPVTESMHPLIGRISEQWTTAREYTARDVPASKSIVQEFIQSPTMPLRDWLKAHPEARSSDDFVTRLAVQLADETIIPQDLARRAVIVRAMGDRLARDPRVVSGDLKSQLLVADASRRKAERLLFDRTREDWLDYATQAFQVAKHEYEVVESVVGQLRSAYRMQIDILDRLPHYLELRMQLALDPYAKLMTYDELKELLVQLGKLRSGIGTQNIAGASAAMRELEPFLIRLAQDPMRYAVAARQQRRPNLQACAAMSMSLALPFNERRELAASIETLDLEAWRRFDPDQPIGDLQLSDRGRATLEEVVTQQLALQITLLRLAGVGLTAPASFQRLDELESDMLSWLGDPQTSSFDVLVERARDALAGGYDDLPLAIRQTFQSISSLDPASSNVTEMVRTCLFSVHLLDPRDLDRLDDETLIASLIEQGRRDQLRLAFDRWTLERDDVREADRAYVESAIEQTTYELRLADPATSIARPVGSVSIDGPSSASLEAVSQRTVKLQLSSDANTALPAWILFEYDETLLDVEATESIQTTDRWPWLRNVQSSSRLAVQQARWNQRDEPGNPEPLQQRAQTLQRAVVYPERPGFAGDPPTFEFDRGANRTITLRIKRKVSVSVPTRLIVKLVTPTDYVRREVEIVFPKPPTLELTSIGPPSMSTPVDDGIILHPLPNRRSMFDLALANRTGGATVCDLTLLVPNAALSAALPGGAVDRARAAEIMESVAPAVVVRRMEEVTVSPGDRIPLMPMFFKSDDESVAPTPPGSAPKFTPSHHGLVLRIDDRLTGETVFRKIGIAPQRPRRFLQPAVDFDLLTRRMEIRVSAKYPSTVPSKGIDVTAEIRGRGNAKPVTLRGVIDAPNYRATLVGYVPSSVDWARVTFDVDGYPRAFIMDVPCSDSFTDFEKQAEPFEVRLLSPTPGRAFQTPVDTIPVGLQVDAPVGSFPFLTEHADFVEVGIDRDRDREFRDERPLRLRSDRSIQVLSAATPTGLQVDVTATDFEIAVPVRNAQDARANVLARLVSGRRSAWSEPIEVVLDGRGPDIEKVVLLPDRSVRIGRQLKVRLWAADGELSGVSKIEVAIDKEGQGEFPKKDPPVAATLDQDGTWIAEVPVEEGQLQPGTYDLLIRATDKVDNQGPIRRQTIRVLEKSDDPDADLACSILGVATYAGVPLANATVTIRRADPASPAAATSDDVATEPKPISTKPLPGPTKTGPNGRYRFDDVYPGRYIVRVVGLARNKPRIEAKELDLVPNQRRQIKLDFDIR